MSVAFANAKATHIFFSKNITVYAISNDQSLQKLLTPFFSKNMSIYAVFNDQSFNDMLTNDIVSF